MAPYEVHTYHLNIDTGDSAVYLLVSFDGKVNTIHRSVLIDGGLGNYGGTTITAFLAKLRRSKYKAKSNREVGKFDAIIITHWDADHYGGIGKLFEQDIRRSVTEAFCYYNPNEPTTKVYCPYWYGSTRPSTWYREQGSNGLKIKYSRDFGRGEWAETTTGLAIIEASYTRMLGYDLFQGISLAPQGDHRALRSPIDVASRITEPAIFCVMSNGFTCGDWKELSQGKWSQKNGYQTIKLNYPPNPIQLQREAEGDFGASLVDERNPTYSNASSIACMIIWPSSQVAESPYISHYFEGDLDAASEDYILRWSTHPTSDGSRSVNEVHTMKLSHHGAKSSTPVWLLPAWKPFAIVASNGMNQRYNHVSWETLILIRTYEKWMRRHLKEKFAGLYCTNYPIYLAKYENKIGSKNLSSYLGYGSIKTFIDVWKNEVDTDFTKMNNELFKLSGSTTLNFMELDPHGNTGNKTIIDILCELFADDWIDFWGFSRRTTNRRVRDLLKSKTQSTRAILIKQKYKQVEVCHLTGKTMYDIDINRFIAGWMKTNSMPSRTLLGISAFKPLNNKTRRKMLNLNELKCMTESLMSFETSEALRIGDMDYEKAPRGNTTSPDNLKKQNHRIERDRSVLEENTPVYILATDTEILDPSINHRLVQAPGSSLDIFLGLLNTGSIVFSNLLTSSFQLSDVDESDELFQWLWAAFGGVNQSQLKFKAMASQTNVQSFQLVVPLKYVFEKQDLVSNAPFFSTLVAFDSRNNVFAFTDQRNQWAKRAVDIDKAVEPARMILLSLGNDAMPTGSTIEFSQLLNMFSIRTSLWLINFSLSLKLTLDQRSGSKNALWFFSNSYELRLRLQFLANDSLIDGLNKSIRMVFDSMPLKISIKRFEIKGSPKIIAKKGWEKLNKEFGDFSFRFDSELAISTRLSITNKRDSNLDLELDTTLVLADDVSTLYILFNQEEGGSSFEKLIDFVLGFFDDIEMPPIGKYLPGAQNFILQRLAFTTKDQGDSFLILNFQITWSTLIFQVDWRLGNQSSFSARLFPENRPEQLGDAFSFVPYMPDYESWTALTVKPKDGVKPSDVASLGTIYKAMNKDADLKPGPLDDQLRIVDLGVLLEDDTIYLDAIMAFPRRNKTASRVPYLQLEAGKLNFQYGWKNHNVDFNIAAQLALRDPKSSSTTYVVVFLGYANNTWSLGGSISGLTGRLLFDIFDSDYNHELANILENIVFNLNVTYSFDANGNGTKLVATGSLLLGDLMLTVDYVHNGKNASGEADWKLTASLSNESSGTNLLSLLQSVCGSDIPLVPDCLGSIPVSPDASKGDIASLEISRGKDGWLFCSISLQLTNSFFFSFLQAQAKRSTSPDQKTFLPPPIRVFTLSVNHLPQVPKVPLIGQIPQPVDEIDLVWVNAGKSSEGIKRSDIDVLNVGLQGSKTNLKYKEPVVKNASPSDIILANGCHFIVSNEKKVIYDCVAQKTKNTDTSSMSALQDPGSKASTTTPMIKKFGPLEVTGFRMKFEKSDKSEVLSIGLDATLVVGPLALTVEDLQLSFVLKNLKDMKDVIAWPSIAGLSASFDRAPITLGAGFKRVDSNSFEGAAALGFTPYLFQAAGFYGESSAGGKPFKSFFIYFILNGPLATIGWAEISGVTGGFGYNVNLNFPTVENVLSFPMLNAPKEQPSGAIGKLVKMNWFYPRDGSFWVAAGLSVYAFQLLTINLVAAVQWNPQITIGLFGVATAMIPKGANENVVFAKIQLGIMASLDIKAGVLAVDGQLTPASFVLSRDCHLTGGFAMYSWFGTANGDHKDDWVFTIGGYHQSFNKPPHYPNPPRLSISWQFDKSISITGEAYFAITPKACMGGGRLRASLSLSPLFAFFDASADFLINYKPFNFQADGDLSVGVKFTLDFWLATINIDIEIGAKLHLEGPPMSGYVHVDFWVFGFDVKFGSKGEKEKPLDLEGFYAFVLESSSSAKAALAHMPVKAEYQGEVEETEDIAPHVFACKTGLIPSNKSESTPNKQPWLVSSTSFSFTVSCKFVIRTAKVYTRTFGREDPVGQVEVTKNKSLLEIYAKPMHLMDEIKTTNLDITISRLKPSLPQILDETKDPMPEWDNVEGILQSVPKALWDRYDATKDPTSGNGDNQIGDLLNGNESSMELMMGVSLSAPKGVESQEDKIKKFKLQDAMGLIAKTAPFPDFTSNTQEEWMPADPKGQQQWKVVADAWRNPGMGKDAPNKALDAWTSALGWEDPGLKSEIPGALVDAIGEVYFDAPQISKG